MVLWIPRWLPSHLKPKGLIASPLDPYMESQGHLVSRIITPISHIVTPIIPAINLLSKSP